MDAQRFISSGIIEAYIAGLASEQEARELETAIAGSAELAAEVDACRKDMEQYIWLQAAAPPPAIKMNLLRMITDEAGRQLDGTDRLDVPAAPETLQEKKGGMRWITVVAIALLLGSLLLNFFFFSRYTAFRQKYTALLAAQSAAAPAASQPQNTRMQQMEVAIRVVQDPSMKIVKMPGAGTHTDAMATVYWNPQSGQLFLVVNQLPPPAAGKQYQLWAMVNGKPVNAGVFNAASQNDIMHKMKPVNRAEAFAITLENEGGSAAPTMEQLFAMGKIVG